MKKIAILFLFFSLFAIPAHADKESKIATLMEAQGALQMWQDQIKLGEQEGKKQAKLIYEKIASQLNPTEEFNERFSKAVNKFMGKLIGNWTAEEIVSTWAKYYGPKFTEEELEQLISFYTSDIGQKDVKASQEALKEFSNYFRIENETIMKGAFDEYIKDLQIIAQECNCRRKK